jgi:hypothetical protein
MRVVLYGPRPVGQFKEPCPPFLSRHLRHPVFERALMLNFALVPPEVAIREPIRYA